MVGGEITDNYGTGPATAGYRYAGGLVGYMSGGEITASYATGPVTAEEVAGGLVGFSSRNVVARIEGSYWDTETTGLTHSNGGVGKTTRELQSPTSDTGIYNKWDPGWWDFGTSSQYPVLKYRGLSVAAQRR